MICYQCGSVLGAGKHCLHCGANIVVYRKIVRTSNVYYNAGLDQARVRDLSGAKLSLIRAVEYDKKNTKARNLLGLIYYETGEIVDALTQWVISKNLQPANNPAEYYLATLSQDKKGLDTMNQAVKKFNQALDAARHEGEDLAIITLRTVIGMNPRYVKAYQLLALLLIKDGDVSGAGKVIKKGLQIDKGNVALQAYIKETKGKVGHGSHKADKLLEKTSRLAGEQVVVPQYKETPKILQILIGFILGAVVSVAAYYTLIGPSIQRAANTEVNQNAISYYEKIEDRDQQVERLTAELEDIQTYIEETKKEIALYTGQEGTITNYERILTAFELYLNKDYFALMDTYASINQEVITSEASMAIYNFLGEYVTSDSILSGIMETAKDYFNKYKYSACREICQTCLDINPEFDEALYFMALSYEASGDDASAAPYFKQIVEKHPESSYYNLAKKRM